MSFVADAVARALPKTLSESDDRENGPEIRSEDGLVAEPAMTSEQAMFETRNGGELKDGQSTKSLSCGSEKLDIQAGKAALENESESEAPKLSEKGIYCVAHSVTDESSRPVSEVEDEPHFDRTAEVSSENFIHGSLPTAEQKRGKDPFKVDHNLIRGSEQERDDFEGADGEIDSVSDGQSHELYSEELKRRIGFPNERLREGDGKEEEEDGEITLISPELQDEQQTSEAELDELSEHRRPLQSGLEEWSTKDSRLEVTKSDSAGTEVSDAASTVRTLSIKLPEEDEESAQQSRRDAEISLFYPQQLDPEDVINPFSLEVRIRKAREQQDISLEWGAETIAEDIVGISRPAAQEPSRLIFPDLEEISRDQPTGPSTRTVENGFPSQVTQRIRSESLPKDFVEDANEPSQKKTGVGEAVLLGALASGVNRPTWFVIRAVLVGLVGSLLLLLHVAIKSGGWFVLLNVLFLISIAGGLILLLGWYISEIGLVSVDKQLAELDLTGEQRKVESKTL